MEYANLLTKKYRLCLYKRVFFVKRFVFAHLCERNFEVGRRSRVGALEITTYFSTLQGGVRNYYFPNRSCPRNYFISPFK